MDLQHGCYYKCLYKKYATVMKRWMSGEGVTTFTKALLTPTGAEMRGVCDVISSSYILVTSEQRTDSNIYVYSGVTGDYSHMLSGLTGHPKTVLLSDHQSMVAANARGSAVVFVWKVQTGECVHSLQHPESVHAIAMHDTRLAVAFRGGVFVWNVHNGQSLHQLVGPEHPYLLVMDSEHLGMCCVRPGTLQLWKLTTGAHVVSMNQDGEVFKILLDSGTHSLVCFLCSNGGCYVWNTETGMCRAIINTGSGDQAGQNGIVIIGTGDRESGGLQDMLIQDEKLYIVMYVEYETENKGVMSVIAIDLKSLSILYRINGGRIEPNMHVNVAVVTNISGLILVIPENREFVYLCDLKNRRCVRDVVAGHIRGHVMEQINASFQMLQVVRDVEGCLTYVRYDFGV